MSARRLVGAESHRRSMVKAVSYRVAGSTTTGLLAWAVAGSVWTGISVGLVDSVAKVFLFYLHERAWHRVTWGLVRTHAAEEQGGGI